MFSGELYFQEKVYFKSGRAPGHLLPSNQFRSVGIHLQVNHVYALGFSPVLVVIAPISKGTYIFLFFLLQPENNNTVLATVTRLQYYYFYLFKAVRAIAGPKVSVSPEFKQKQNE